MKQEFVLVVAVSLACLFAGIGALAYESGMRRGRCEELCLPDTVIQANWSYCVCDVEGVGPTVRGSR